MRNILCAIALCTLAAAPATAAPSAAIQFLISGKVLPTTLPFSEVVRLGNTLYLSGQIGIAPGTMKPGPVNSNGAPA